MRYIVFDVETPNGRNHRMSAIGVCEVEDGEITRKFYSLVNPETHFERFNMELTGITPAGIVTVLLPLLVLCGALLVLLPRKRR